MRHRFSGHCQDVFSDSHAGVHAVTGISVKSCDGLAGAQETENIASLMHTYTLPKPLHQNAWPLTGAHTMTMQDMLREWTSRPSTACIWDVSTANVELMRAINLEPEAYCRLRRTVYCKVCLLHWNTKERLLSLFDSNLT